MRATSDNPDPILQQYIWLLEGDRMDRAFALAERTAAGLGADSVRVDIFMPRNLGEEPLVNEISFSSGHYYRHHERAMSKLWQLGYKWHKEGQNRVYDGNDMPIPNNHNTPDLNEPHERGLNALIGRQ